MSLNAALRAYWDERGIANPSVATPEDIAAFEARHRVRLPPAIVDYFLVVNGTREGRWGMEDEDLISFSHLDQVQSLRERYPDDPHPDAAMLFVVADHSIDAWAWAVRLSADAAAPTPVFIVAFTVQQIAASFDEYVDGYMRREPSVIFPLA